MSSTPRRPGSRRDRRGRGARGPRSLSGALHNGLPIDQSGRAWFDAMTSEAFTEIQESLAHQPGPVEVIIEEAPMLPHSWDEPVPSSVVRASKGGPQVVVYRLPIISRAQGTQEVTEAVWAVLLHHLSDVWGVGPDELDPR